MGVHLDESKTTVRLEAGLNHKTKVLEKRDQVVLGGVRGQVAHVASCLPGWSLIDNHIVRVNAVGGEVMMAVGGRRGHAHLLHGLLLGNRRLALLVGPVATDGARTEPLAVHGAQSLLSLGSVAESNEAITARTASLHIPHDTSLGNRAESGKGLKKDLIVDLVRKIANKDVEVVRSVLLVRVVRLISPVDTNFLYRKSVSFK